MIDRRRALKALLGFAGLAGGLAALAPETALAAGPPIEPAVPGPEAPETAAATETETDLPATSPTQYYYYRRRVYRPVYRRRVYRPVYRRRYYRRVYRRPIYRRRYYY